MTPREVQSGYAARILATSACLRDQVKAGMLMIESAVFLGREERSGDNGHGGPILCSSRALHCWGVGWHSLLLCTCSHIPLIINR